MPSVAFFRLTARSVLCVCMERNSLPIVPGTDNSHNRRRRPVTRHCEALFYFLERSFLAGLTGGHGGVVGSGERAHNFGPAPRASPANETVIAGRVRTEVVRQVTPWRPDRKTQNMPLRTRRSFTRGTPRGLLGSIGLMAIHSSLESS